MACNHCGATACAGQCVCTRVGTPGHWQCGTCDEHKRPRRECGCYINLPKEKAAIDAKQK